MVSHASMTETKILLGRIEPLVLVHALYHQNNTNAMHGCITQVWFVVAVNMQFENYVAQPPEWNTLMSLYASVILEGNATTHA